MNLLKNIFARIWAFWALVTFIITFLIFFLPSMATRFFREPEGQRYFINISRWWMNVWLFLVGCPVKVMGRSNFAKGETYVVVFNHNAFMDVPLSAPYVPGANKTIAKKSFTKIPLFGLFYAKGAVLVDRSNDKSRGKSFEDMKKVLATGMHMCIYPEGTRNRTSEPLKSFYDGAFKLAVNSGKAIIPCVISGTKKAMPITKTFYLLPTRLKMNFMPPVSSAGKTVAQLKDEVFVLMRDFYVKTNPGM